MTVDEFKGKPALRAELRRLLDDPVLRSALEVARTSILTARRQPDAMLAAANQWYQDGFLDFPDVLAGLAQDDGALPVLPQPFAHVVKERKSWESTP